MGFALDWLEGLSPTPKEEECRHGKRKFCGITAGCELCRFTGLDTPPKPQTLPGEMDSVEKGTWYEAMMKERYVINQIIRYLASKEREQI